MTQVHSHRLFEAGTTGWTVDDWYELDSQGLLPEGRYEIVDGVLTEMAPQGFEGIDPQSNLRRVLERQLDAVGQQGRFYHEVDVLLRRNRVARPDMIYLTRDQRQQQKKLQEQRKKPKGRYHPVYVIPLLIVESVSLGREKHDLVTKRKWYADARVPHYWLLTAHKRSFVCLTLQGDHYVEESSGVKAEVLHSQAFGGVSIPLSEVWDD
jgi:Uma2 family endonuclease